MTESRRPDKVKMDSIAYYVSGHGFGHAVRSATVLRALRRLAPGLRLVVRTAAPAFLFEGIDPPFELVPGALDVGVAQRDSLTPDIPATFRRLARFLGEREGWVAREAAFLKKTGASLVVGDAPHAPFLAARRAGLPSACVANFTFDWIYEDYLEELPAGVRDGAGRLVERVREGYAAADILYRVPPACPMPGFRRVVDGPLVVRFPSFSKAEARRRLGLPEEEKVVILSFGGFGLRDLEGWDLDRAGEFLFVVGEDQAFLGGRSWRLDRRGLGYADLVRAGDAVLTKPGYGIYADCTAARTPLAHTSRGRFAEYAYLLEAIREKTPNIFIPPEDFAARRWGSYLDELLRREARWGEVPLGGGEETARHLVEGLAAGFF